MRNAEVVLGLVQLGLQTVHTGDGQHELGGSKTSPAVGGEGEGEGEGKKVSSQEACRYTIFDTQYLMYWEREREGGGRRKREREREGGRGGGERANLFSVHNRSRVKIDVDSIPVLANFKTIHLYIQINARYCTCNSYTHGQFYFCVLGGGGGGQWW